MLPLLWLRALINPLDMRGPGDKLGRRLSPTLERIEIFNFDPCLIRNRLRCRFLLLDEEPHLRTHHVGSSDTFAFDFSPCSHYKGLPPCGARWECSVLLPTTSLERQ